MNTDLLLKTIDEHGLESRLASGETEIIVDCPRCHKQKLYLNATTGLWTCFVCETRGNLQGFLLDICDLPPFEAYSLSRRIRGRILKTPSSAAQPLLRLARRPNGPLPTVELPPFYLIPKSETSATARYLVRRGIDPRLIDEYEIGWCPDGPYRGRVIIPVYTEGQLLTWVARDTTDTQERKVLMPKHSQAAAALFNHEHVEPPLCVLVEGVFDALRLPHLAIATLGAHLTAQQRRTLKRLGYTQVILLRDGDTTGRNAALQEALELVAARFEEVAIATLPDGVDPGSATEEQLDEALANAHIVDVSYGSQTVLQKEVHPHG